MTAHVPPDSKPFTVEGQDAWALQRVIITGPAGCTPIDLHADQPAGAAVEGDETLARGGDLSPVMRSHMQKMAKTVPSLSSRRATGATT